MGLSVTTLVGNLTKDIELLKTNSGKSVVKFTLAINHYKDEVSFIDCEAWGQTAEFLAKYAKKGQTIGASGRLTQQRWEKDGEKRSKLVVSVREAQILSRKDDQADNAPSGEAVGVDDNEPIDLSSIPF